MRSIRLRRVESGHPGAPRSSYRSYDTTEEPADSPSRWPTSDELRAALGALPGCTVSYTHKGDTGWDADVVDSSRGTVLVDDSSVRAVVVTPGCDLQALAEILSTREQRRSLLV